MTLSELFSVQTDNRKLKSLYMELDNNEDFNPCKKNIFTGIPRNKSYENFNDYYIKEKERINRQIDYYKDKIREDRRKVEKYIETAPQPERDIIRFRVINNLDWNEIGQLVNMDRRTASRKFYKYIKVAHNARQDMIK